MAFTLYSLGDREQSKYYLQQSIDYISNNWVFGSALIAITGIAMILADEEKPERALELLALALPQHKDPSYKQIGEKLRIRLEAELDQATYQAAWERGKSLDLKTVVHELSEEFGNVS